MRVGMLSADWGDYVTSSPGGCTWIRFFGPAGEMNNLGIHTVIGEVGWVDGEGFVAVPTVDRLKQQTRGPIKDPSSYEGGLDVIILKLWMWHEANDLIKKAQDLGQTIIIDIDDWFHGLPTTNIAFETTHPDRDATWNRNHMLATYRNVDGLITSTEFLNDFYSKHNKNCYQVHNSLKPQYFIKRYDAAGWKPTIGWVGIVPLNSLPFNEAKSSVKGLEYAMTGIPFVAYASNEYKKLELEGSGNTAKKPMQWIKNMERLLDPAVRKEQADRGYELVSTKYNVENVVHLWIEAIEKIVKANPKSRLNNV